MIATSSGPRLLTVITAATPGGWNRRELGEDAAIEQRGRYEEESWQDRIAEFLDRVKVEVAERRNGGVTIGEILANVLRVGGDDYHHHDVSKWKQQDSNRVAKCLKALGWERKQVRDSNSKKPE